MPRTPGTRLLLVALAAVLLTIPLLAVYALVRDREDQSQTAQESISAGWGGPQVVSGPILAVPYMRPQTHTESVDGREVTRTENERAELFIAPEAQSVHTRLDPHKRRRSIYSSVIYVAALDGTANFVLPADLSRSGITRDQLLLDQAELRFGVSDPRGLQQVAAVSVGGKALALQPGKGPAASNGSGFFAPIDWSGAAPVQVTWRYTLRGSHSLALVPRGGETAWDVSSPWPSPSFAGSFLPAENTVGAKGFTAHYSVSNLALGQELVSNNDPAPPSTPVSVTDGSPPPMAAQQADDGGASMAASIGLVEPVNLYSQVDRSVKYGFLFIGFTFLAFFMFDVVAGARVVTAEYLLTGAGLVLFFVLLLAFAEVVGFTPAYIVASVAIIGLLTAYRAAVLRTRRRAGFIGALLTGLYAVMYVLLSLEDLSLLIGSVLLFVALAWVMYLTRNVEWSRAGREEETAA
jgi:inner membrane protein